MKILLLMDSPMIPTGYASTCRLTAKELRKKGHDIYAMAFNGGPHVSEITEWCGIKIVPNQALSRERNAIYGDAEGVKWACSQINPDLLFWHNDSYRYAYINELPTEITKKSVFWLPFEGDNADMQGVGMFSKCAATRFVTKHALNMHKEYLKGKDIGFIPHAIDLENLNPCQDKRASKASKKLGVENKFVVVRVDRHQPRKYWDRTLKAFAKFANDKDDVFLTGKCDPRDITMFNIENGKSVGVDLDALATELGIRNKVDFNDFFFDDAFMAPAFFHPADIFLSTTSGEGFGLCPAAAMACGLPVICPDTPVLPEVLGGDDERDNGGALFAKLEGRIYYEPMHVWHNIVSIDDVAAKLEFAYQDWKTGGKELAKIGQKARELATRKYSPKTVYDQWDQVFKDVIDRDKLVSVVTVLYNLKGDDQITGDDGIERFRTTFEEHVKTPYEWIIVDNGSPQREITRKWMRLAAEKNPRIKPIFLDVNMGFAGGNNIGIAETRGKWVVLANPDSEALDPQKQFQPADFLKMLVDSAKKDPKIGIIGMELHDRDDVMPGLNFPYFCCVLITRECLDSIKLGEDKWFDEKFWPAYYEDADLSVRARGKGFKIIEDKNVTFFHKSGGTNKFAIEGGATGPFIEPMSEAIEFLSNKYPDMADWKRKKAEIATGGMISMINGNIDYLNQKYGPSARAKIKIVWHVHIGNGVGFSQIAEGCAPAMEEAGFDVYVNDWSNGANIEDQRIVKLWEKYKKANMEDGLENAIHIVCWLMETFLNVEENYKIGISFCESTKVRESYLHACNGMDRILTFSEFCRGVQKNSGYTVPIDVIPPAVNPIYLKYHDRPARDKFTFLCVGVAQERKDTNRLVQLFCEAFPKNSPYPPECGPGFPVKPSQVELVIKSNVFGELSWVEPFKQRANIRTIFTGTDQRAERNDFTIKEMRELYEEADALVHASHGEGIGYPLIEAAATGLPVIFTNWSSPSEYFDESNSYPVCLSPYPGTTFTKAYPGAPGDNGVWSNMHCGHLKYQMYNVVKDRDEARKKGKAAHEHMKKNFTWPNTVKQMIPLIFEWDSERHKKSKKNLFDPLTYVKPKLQPVQNTDRVMVDVCSRDRHLPLCCLLTSLLGQTFKNWDITIQCDDADESMPNDFMIMSIMNRIQHEGHGWRIIRSFRQGPHMAHDRTLQQTTDDPMYKYKLICRIDDDIILKPDYLEKLFKVFLEDNDAQIAAVGGVYLDPKRSDSDQMAPANFSQDINYAGIIDHNVPWPYICRYPDGTPSRLVEHLYSSFLYRVEVANSIGGYCRKFSQIGHREESDFSYRFFLAGFKQFIQPLAVGYHFSAPSGGIRDSAIVDRNTLAEMDHQIYERRLRKWKQRLELRKRKDKEERLPPPTTEQKEQITTPITPPDDVSDMKVKKGKIVCVINGGNDIAILSAAVDRFKALSDEIYVTCESEKAKGLLSGRTAAVVTTPKEAAVLTKQLMSEGDHEFVMVVMDYTMFVEDPRPLLDNDHDDYVFECYKTYISGRTKKDDKGNVTFVQDDSIGITIGPEVENKCLIHRRNNNTTKNMERIVYLDSIVLNDERIPPVDGKSIHGNELLLFSEIHDKEWTKICTFQFPEGKLKNLRHMTVKPVNEPMVSIIIPTPGRIDHLKKCVSSIYSYTTTPFELIIVDNDSQDGTAKFLEGQQFRRNFHSVRLNANVGYQRAINHGITMAKGKYILLFNDDAWVESMMPDGRDWVKTLMDELEKDPKLGLIGPHGETSPALGTPMLFFWCVMMRRSVFDEVGPLDDLTFKNYGGDDDFCERLRKAGYQVRCQSVFSGILRHLMNLVPQEQKNKELEESVRRLRKKYPELAEQGKAQRLPA